MTQLQAAHDEAGARYVRAAHALRAAHLELAAYDIATATDAGLCSFDDRLVILGHARYLHGDALAVLNRINTADIRARVGQLLTSLEA